MSLQIERASIELGGRRVAEEVSLAVSPGEIVALLGPNGAGKTSLMRAGLGLLPLAAGTARLGGDDPRTLTPRARALRAAYLPQRPQAIWPLSVERLVALGRYAHGAAPDRLGARDAAAVDEALEACALTHLRHRRMDELSGGEKARAHLARALAQHAPLLVLDEPTAGLDPAQALGVGDVLRAQAGKGRAVLFATHDIALAVRVASKMILLRDARVVAQGGLDALTPEALAAAYGRPARIVQTGGATIVAFD